VYPVPGAFSKIGKCEIFTVDQVKIEIIEALEIGELYEQRNKAIQHEKGNNPGFKEFYSSGITQGQQYKQGRNE
jgi:hypothetical protein